MERWNRRNGYRHVLKVCLPLVASMGSITLMQFTNRIFLANHSVEAISAALPAGIASFTFFVQMLGRIGPLEMAVSNIVLSIETLSFLPMVGLHIANTTLVGQAVGGGMPDEGSYATTSALHITLAYMSLIAVIFIFFPDPLLKLFKPQDASAREFSGMLEMGANL